MGIQYACEKKRKISALETAVYTRCYTGFSDTGSSLKTPACLYFILFFLNSFHYKNLLFISNRSPLY